MRRIDADDKIGCGSADFWRVFRLAAYNETLFMGELRYDAFAFADRAFRREVRARPGLHGIPFSGVIGDALEYEEAGTFRVTRQDLENPYDLAYAFRVVNTKWRDALEVVGQIWTISQGHASCRRLAEVEIRVKKLGIATVVEERIAHELRRALQISARLTEAWVEGPEAVAKYAEGRASR